MKAMKKIISAVSAVVMLASTFAAMTTVNAAKKDLYLDGSVKGKNVTIDIYAGSDVAKVSGFTLYVKPSATATSGKVIDGGYLGADSVVPNFTNGMVVAAYSTAVAKDVDSAKPLIRYEFTMQDEITSDVTFEIVSLSTKKNSTFTYLTAEGKEIPMNSKSTTAAELSLLGTSVTVKAPAPAEKTVTAEKIADAVANDGDIYKYTPFKAAIDFDKQTIKGAKVGDITVPKEKISNIPTEITGSATVGIIVKSLASQTVGAVKLIVE